jgi:hypothetical protein
MTKCQQITATIISRFRFETMVSIDTRAEEGDMAMTAGISG